MKFLHYLFIFGMIVVFFLQSGCSKKKISQEMKDNQEKINESFTKSKTEDSSTIDLIWKGIQNL